MNITKFHLCNLSTSMSLYSVVTVELNFCKIFQYVDSDLTLKVVGTE